MLDDQNYISTNLIIENVISNFTTCVHGGEVFIFCKNIYGDIILCKSSNINNAFNNNISFSNIILFKDLSNLFYPIFLNNNLSLIYSNYSSNMLAIKSTKADSNNSFNWNAPENIDIISSTPNQISNPNEYSNLNLLDLYKVHQTNFILSYIKFKSNKELQAGFKVISNGALSDFIIFHKTGHQLVDYSIICFDNKIHIIYIIKNLFSTQVIYRNYYNNILSNPILLFEGQKIKTCCACVINNKVYCQFIIGNTLYYLISDDYGSNFSSVMKYKRSVSQEIQKIKFLDFNSSERCSFNEVFADDPQNLLNLQFVMDFAPHIFNRGDNPNSSSSGSPNFIKNILDLGGSQEESNLNNNTSTNFTNNTTNQFISNISSNNDEAYVEYVEPVQVRPPAPTPPPQPRPQNQSRPNQQKPQPVYTSGSETDFMAQFDMSKFESMLQSKKSSGSVGASGNNVGSAGSSSNSILESRLKILEEQLKDKNNEVFQLNSLMQSRNKERTELENSLRLQLDSYKKELADLKAQVMAEVDKAKSKEEIKEVSDNKNIDSNKDKQE